MIEALIAGLAGLLIGSFLNVCIYRLPRDLSVVSPRSFCPGCEHGIAWYDNIPVLSYLILRGRCRHCQVRIRIRYPLVEFLTAACFFATVWLFGLTAVAIKDCVFEAILIALLFTDLEERILPDEFTIGGTIVGLILAFVIPADSGLLRFILPAIKGPRVLSLLAAAFAALFSSLSLWLIGVLYKKLRNREGLGLGDVKMVAMVGAFLGLQGVMLTLIVGSVLGALIGLGFIFLTGKDAATYELPFGAFLGIGGLAVVFWLRIAGA